MTTATISSLRNLVEELLALKAQISDLSDTLKDLKAQEESLKTSILYQMEGSKSMNLDGLAKIVRKEKTHYEIRDREALARAILRLMVEQGQQGKPLSEALLLQQRVSSRVLEEHLEAMGLDEATETGYLESSGLARVTEPTLSITRN